MDVAEIKSNEKILSQIQLLRDNLTKVILGKSEVVDQVILGLVSGESILIETFLASARPRWPRLWLRVSSLISSECNAPRICFPPTFSGFQF